MIGETQQAFVYRYRLDLGTKGSMAYGDEPKSPNPRAYADPWPTQTFDVTRGDETKRHVLGRCRVERDALGMFWVRTNFEIDLEKEGLRFYGQWDGEDPAQLINVWLLPKRLWPRLSPAEE